ncbi:hypothetical protein [Paraburkholderia bryophila]|uniref:hypothetical protein n=1 Tax=Paraburkholderia bryophila TaxID=420952 RepID=UPI0011BE03DA|nr:hypothetical protein [Paraburkholderia bryophila]
MTDIQIPTPTRSKSSLRMPVYLRRRFIGRAFITRVQCPCIEEALPVAVLKYVIVLMEDSRLRRLISISPWSAEKAASASVAPLQQAAVPSPFKSHYSTS